MNNIFKTIIISSIVFFSALFIGNADVKADGDGTGYAKCTYDFTEDRYNISPYRYYRVNVVFYKTGNDFNSYKSYASVECTKSDEASSKMYKDLCSIDNYDLIFHNASNYQAKYKKSLTDVNNHINPTWNCPSQMYINRDKYNNKMSVWMDKKTCDNKNLAVNCSVVADLKEKEIKQSGKPDGTASSGDLWLDDTTGNLTNEKPAGSDSKGESNIDGIKKWGTDVKEFQDSDEGNYTDYCSLISQDIKNIITGIFWVITIAGIIAMIVMSALDFIKAITGSDDENLKKAFKNTVIRAIFLIVLLLLPSIVTWIINIVNIAGAGDNNGKQIKIGSDNNPYCDTIK